MSVKFIKKNSSLTIVLYVFAIAYHIFFHPLTVGHNHNYILYIFWLPTITGWVIFAWCNRKDFVEEEIERTFLIEKIFNYFHLGIIFFAFSYLSFGQIAKISWDIANYQIAKTNLVENLNCQITGLTKGSYSAIYFNFKNTDESINSFMKLKRFSEFYNTDLDSCSLNIKVQKGIWNYYLVDEYKIIQHR
jgi:hypothetical protein